MISRIVFITSFYGGLKNSIVNNKWNPEGMPAIAKLLIGLKNADIPFDYYLIVRDKEKKYKPRYQLDEFPGSYFFTIYPGNALFKLRKLATVFSLIDNIIDFRIARFIKTKERYLSQSVVYYVDRNNVRVGAILANFFNSKVILRLHGVINMYRDFTNTAYVIRNYFRCLSYKARFRYIIGTEDGTATREFILRFTNKNTKHVTLLNGVDPIRTVDNSLRIRHRIKDDIPIILFLTRIEPYKGSLTFIESLIELNKINKQFHAIIVGDGSLLQSIKNKLRVFTNVTFTGSIPHNEIHYYFNIADIYVNLSYPGNLPNTVLESLVYGKCIITYGVEKSNYVNISTRRLLGDAAFFIDREKDEGKCQLVDRLDYLLSHHHVISEMKKKSLEIGKRNLNSWDSRIDKEIEIIKRI
jgi:glycosyltransferase involved in cell wall biosynthesis